MRMFSRGALVKVGLIGGIGLLGVACQPQTPVALVLNVTTTVDGSDASPGNGVCEMTSGLGDCSLRAAVDEGNAQIGRLVTVNLPPGMYALGAGTDDDNSGGDLDLAPASSSLTIVAPQPGAVVDAQGGDAAFDIRSGAIRLQGINATDGAAGVVVRSGAIATITQSSLSRNDGAGLRIDGGGSAQTVNTTIAANGASGVTATGAFDGVFTTVTANAGGGVIGAGQATFTASVVGQQASGSDCSKKVVSLGFNLDTDGSCLLSKPTDAKATPAGLGSLGSGALDGAVPQPGSAARDAIPAGTAPCAGTPPDDQRATPRPSGPACDRGAIEAGITPTGPLSLTVDTGTDASDAAPGDRVCLAVGGGCTLRAAVDETNANDGPDSITLATNVTLSGNGLEDTNASGDIDIADDVSIEGASHILDAAHVDRVIHVLAGTVQIEDTTITGGQSFFGAGGGLRLEAGTLTVASSTISGNSSPLSDGGGIYQVGGTLTLRASTVSGNTANPSDVAGLGQGGGLRVQGGTTRIEDTTFSGNVALGSSVSRGGAISSSNLSDIDIERSTFVDNQATQGSAFATAPFVLELAGSALTGDSPLCDGSILSGGFNFATDASCSLTATGDHPNLSGGLSLGPLADNGGPTLTHLPSAGPLGSPVVDAIPTGTSGLCDISTPFDQRGESRPSGLGCDAGSVELPGPLPSMPKSFTVDNGADLVDATPGDGVCSVVGGGCTLRAAVTETNANLATDTITLATDVAISRPGREDNTNATGDIDSHDGLTIVGAGHTIDANDIDRAIDQFAGGLSVEDVRIVDGNASSPFEGFADELTGAGGAIRSQSDVELVGSTIESNIATGPENLDIDQNSHHTRVTGGGVSVTNGDLTVSNSIVRNNSGTRILGGGVGVDSGDLEITASIVTGNVAHQGGGAFVRNGSATIDTTEIADNSVGVYTEWFGDSLECDTCFTDHEGNGAGLAVEAGTATVRRSTIAGNRASFGNGGGIFTTVGGSVTVEHTTITNNEALLSVAGGDGGAVAGGGTVGVVYSTIVDNVGAASISAPSLSLRGTIVRPTAGPSCAVTGGSSLGHNVTTDDSCPQGGAGDHVNTAVPLAPLADNGGPTRTRLPFADSPSVDAIPVGTAQLCDGAAPTDQRGVARPAGPACDVGAVEGDNGLLGGVALALEVDTNVDARDATIGDGVCDIGDGTCSLRAAIDETNATPSVDTITIGAFDPVLGLSGALENANATGDLDVTESVSIDGNGATVDAQDLDRVFDVRSGDVVLRELTITDGSVTGDNEGGGGIRVVLAAVEVVSTTIQGNVANGIAGGGGIRVDGGSLLTRRTTITANSSVWGGGLIQVGGQVTVQSTTINANSGGGVVNRGLSGTLAIVNSTLSANTGYYALWGDSGTSTVVQLTTIADNNGGFGQLFREVGGSLTISGSIIKGAGVACLSAVGSGGYNVVQGTGCGLTSTGDVQGVDPLIGTLANNGGPTLTHLPQVGSAARNRIPIGTAGLCDGSFAADQRIVARPQGAACDSGSVEQ